MRKTIEQNQLNQKFKGTIEIDPKVKEKLISELEKNGLETDDSAIELLYTSYLALKEIKVNKNNQPYEAFANFHQSIARYNKTHKDDSLKIINQIKCIVDKLIYEI